MLRRNVRESAEQGINNYLVQFTLIENYYLIGLKYNERDTDISTFAIFPKNVSGF